MARDASEALLAEIARLRTHIGKLDQELLRVRSRLAFVEGRLNDSQDVKSAPAPRDTGKRLH